MRGRQVRDGCDCLLSCRRIGGRRSNQVGGRSGGRPFYRRHGHWAGLRNLPEEIQVSQSRAYYTVQWNKASINVDTMQLEGTQS